MRGLLGILTTLSGALPALAPIVAVVLLAAALAFYASAGDPTVIAVVSAAALAVMLLVTLLRALLKRKRTKSFENNLSAQRSAIKAQAKENLQDVRAKFLETLDVLRSNESGSDYLYTVPWYVIFGEPASGKTTTIKTLANTGIRFLGTGDKMRGIGGTANCDWWFSDHAVILDTAGRWAIPEELAPDKVEWEGFLDLLAKFRPRQPINGAIVVIPTDRLYPGPGVPEAALIADAKEKGEQLRDRLDKLQGHLKVSFPVYVLVTKADRIEGFEDFFVSLPAAYQTTLFGWSNTHDLEERWDSQWIDEAYASMEKDLERARYLVFSMESMSFDAAPRVYLFPKQFQRTKGTLQVYLEAMFSRLSYEKNVFLRGIYYTSGHQEREGGKALFRSQSQTMADTGAVRIDWAPRPYFIHDFYKEKVFREKGLVRPHARELRRRLAVRRVALVVAILVLVVGFVATAVVAYRRGSVAAEAEASIAFLRRETPSSADNTFFRPGYGITSWDRYLAAVEKLPAKVGHLLEIGAAGDGDLRANLGTIVERVLSRAVLQPALDHVALTFPYHKGYQAPPPDAEGGLRLPPEEADRDAFATWSGRLDEAQWMQLRTSRPGEGKTPREHARALAAYAAEQVRILARLIEHGPFTRWGLEESNDFQALLPVRVQKIGDELDAVLVRGSSPRNLEDIGGSIRLHRRYPVRGTKLVRTDLLLGELEQLFEREAQTLVEERLEAARQWTAAFRDFRTARTWDALAAWRDRPLPEAPDLAGVLAAHRTILNEHLAGVLALDAANQRFEEARQRWLAAWNTGLSALSIPAFEDPSRVVPLAGADGALEPLASAAWQEAREASAALDQALGSKSWQERSVAFDVRAEARAYFVKSVWVQGGAALAILERSRHLAVLAPLTPAEQPDPAQERLRAARDAVRALVLDKACQKLGAELVNTQPTKALAAERHALLARAPAAGDTLPLLEVLAQVTALDEFGAELAVLPEDSADHAVETLAFLRTLPESSATPSIGGWRRWLEGTFGSHLECTALALRGALLADVAGANLPPASTRAAWNPLERPSPSPGEGDRLTPALTAFATPSTRRLLTALSAEGGDAPFSLRWLAAATESLGVAALRAMPRLIRGTLRDGFLARLEEKTAASGTRPKEFYGLQVPAALLAALPPQAGPLERDAAALQEAIQNWYVGKLVGALANGLHGRLTGFAALRSRPFRLEPQAPALDLAGVRDAYAGWFALLQDWSARDDAFELPAWLDRAFDDAPGRTPPTVFVRETHELFVRLYPVLFGTGKTVDWKTSSWMQQEQFAAPTLVLLPDYAFRYATIQLELAIGSRAFRTEAFSGFTRQNLGPLPQLHLPTQVVTTWRPPTGSSWRIDMRSNAIEVDPQTGTAKPEGTAEVAVKPTDVAVRRSPPEARPWFLLEWLEAQRESAAPEGGFTYSIPFQFDPALPLQTIVVRNAQGREPVLITGKLGVTWEHSLDAVYQVTGQADDRRTTRRALENLAAPRP